MNNKMGKKVKISTAKSAVVAVIENNPTSKDFLSLLPLTLRLEDYNQTEKISNLSKKLTLKNAPAGYKPSAGDITLYAPWGNLAIFYKDYSYSKGLIYLGKIETTLDAFIQQDSFVAIIELL